MEKNIIVPALGESIKEGTIAQWYKKVGELVKMDETIAAIETDKVTIEISSPISGILSKITKNEGDIAEVNAVIGIVKETENHPNDDNDSEAKNNDNSTVKNSNDQQLIAHPSAKKLAKENNIDINNITGTGKNNRIIKGDVIDAIDQQSHNNSKPSTSSSTHDDTSYKTSDLPQTSMNYSNDMTKKEKMSKLRQTIAKRLKDSQNTAAILTTFNEVDMYNIISLRKKYKEDFQKHHNIKLGLMSFFVKAVIESIKQFPIINAEISEDCIIYKYFCNIGVAVSTESGLVVPILKHAEQMSFAQIEQSIVKLSLKAREKKLTMEDLSGGTFSITNGGTFGSLLSTPIINPPQSGIMGMHSIQERAVVINGTIQIRPMMYLALSYDHRIIDGRDAVGFLVKVKEKIENPERLLLEI